MNFVDIVTYAHFFINRTFISNNLCVNQDKPELMCRGKCYLDKQITKNNERDNKSPVVVNKTKIAIQYIVTDIWLDALAEDNKKKKGVIDYISGNYVFLYDHDVFHPPKLS